MPESDEGKRIDLTNCIFCPFREDDICVVEAFGFQGSVIGGYFTVKTVNNVRRIGAEGEKP